MEVWVLIGLAILNAEWFALIVIFIIGFVCAFWRRSRRVGTIMMLLSGGTMAFWFLTPERISLFPTETIVSEISSVAFTMPSALVLHANERSIAEGLTLAETGLFRVFKAGRAADAPVEGEMLLADAAGCAESRTDPNGDWSFSSTQKMGGLMFTARTGFERCATYVPGPADVPADRLDVWPIDPPGERQADYYNGGGLLGVLLLTITENGQRRTVARREMRARRVATSLARQGVAAYDARPENTEENPYQYYPDLLDFVLTALHVDVDDLPKAGALSDAELARRAPAIVAGAPGDIRKLRTAVALAGATRGAAASGAVVAEVAPVMLDPRRSLEIRVPSDCRLAQRAAEGRQALAPACNAAWAAGGRDPCSFPLDPPPFLERCTGIRDRIWDTARQGRPTVVFGKAGGERVGVGLSSYGYASKVRVAVEPGDGLLDLVLVARDPILWSLERAVGCLGRVTVVGTGSAVIGIERSRVQFRDRFAASRYEAYQPGSLADLLGRAPDRTVSVARDETAVIGDRGLKGAGCRTAAGAAPSAEPIITDVVTGPLDVAVPLSNATGCRTFRPGTIEEAIRSRCVAQPPQIYFRQ